MKMERRQFRVLYREFLFRIVDLEILSSRSDVTKLLGQFAAMLAALSFMLAIHARRYAEMELPAEDVLISAWPIQHFLIATTMLMTGLFALLSWDSAFPDRRDVLVLAPLPVRARTFFRAKIAALGSALGLTVVAANVFTGISYPLVLGALKGGVLGIAQSFAAYWLTAFGAGAFVLGTVLALQGAALHVLPRRIFLRASGFLQLLAFCLLLSVYILQPHMATPRYLIDPQNRLTAVWLPSYWFLGLLQELSGSPHPALEAFGRLAWAGLAIACLSATATFLLSYFRTLRKIVDEPDIAPRRRAAWLPSFRDSVMTAVFQFSARTLMRGRQHRLILAFYLGIGLAFALASARSVIQGRSPHSWNDIDGPLLVSSIVVLCLCVLGIRVVFTMPIALAANWIFRVTATRGATGYLEAGRRALLLLSVAPVWAVSAILLRAVWLPAHAVGHLLVLALLGLMFVELSFHGFRKIPFTCSYLPGKANIHVVSGAYALVMLAITDLFVQFERIALRGLPRFAVFIAVLGTVALLIRRRTNASLRAPGAELRFDELPERDIHAIELHRDGVLVER